jgi:exodeoxyribonuclease VII large subunit
LARPGDLIRSQQQRLDDLDHRSSLALRGAVLRSAERLRLLEATLGALNPMNVLARGYAIIERNAAPVARATELHPGDPIIIRMHDGTRNAVVEEDDAGHSA